MVGKDLEEINGRFDRHRGEINRLKIREKTAKEETEELKGFIIGAGHEAQVFKNRLDRMEENICRCGRTPSGVAELLQKLGRSLCLRRMKGGQSSPTLR